MDDKLQKVVAIIFVLLMVLSMLAMSASVF